MIGAAQVRTFKLQENKEMHRRKNKLWACEQRKKGKLFKNLSSE